MRTINGIRRILAILFFFFSVTSFGATIKGKVTDRITGEELIDVHLLIADKNLGSVSGLDGSFIIRNVPIGKHIIVARSVGYDDLQQIIEVKGEDDELLLNFALIENQRNVTSVEVIAEFDRESDEKARHLERKSDNVVNVMSAKSIEISPDITVSNVVQRVSGLTVERNNNGDGQYAIVRGMDKRYNYTLVNGIKIPSPDNSNRYVPLDIFPADLMDRLVVYKTLTPSMEGDAIGGVVDMVMKDAPNKFYLRSSLSTGYNGIFLQRPYDYFDHTKVSRLAPMEDVAKDKRAATIEDFTTQNLNFSQRTPRPSVFGNISIGNRYFKDKLGVMIAASYQDSYRGSDRREFRVSAYERGGENRPIVGKMQDRSYSVQQQRAALHNKIDYKFNRRHKLSLYNAFFNLQTNETRVLEDLEMRNTFAPPREYNWRSHVNIQRIYNSTLKGDHHFNTWFRSDWSLAYSKASQNSPDLTQIETVSEYDGDNISRWLVHENILRLWERNSDQDYAGYLNLTFTPSIAGQEVELTTGGMTRFKSRTNFFEQYTFKPLPGIQEYIPYVTDYADLTWRVTNGAGTPTHVLNYLSNENVYAGYGQFKFLAFKTQVLGGLRAEYTDLNYVTLSDRHPEGGLQYANILPSLHFKYMPVDKVNVRASYYRAISRPGFFEVIPYRRPSGEELYTRGGNPDLLPATSDNLDMRFEYFHKPNEQILVGVFYKKIYNPIEYAIFNTVAGLTFMPANFDEAINRGFELDYIKYFRNFGIRANYTFTLSEIESVKRTYTRITEDNIGQLTPEQLEQIGLGDSTFVNVRQMRPLQGQSKHLANVSLLYKNAKSGLNGQLSMVYTGERIATVSTELDADFWQKSFVQLDFSVEKSFAKKWIVFAKINNLLNTPYEVVMKKPHLPFAGVAEYQPNGDKETLIRRDIYDRTYMLGVRFNL